jgi:hypothetical protein
VIPVRETTPNEMTRDEDGKWIVYTRPPIIIVKPELSSDALKQTRNAYQGLPTGVIPLEPMSETIFCKTLGSKFRVTRQQIPLTGSCAITDFKSQGGTYEKVVVDFVNVNAGASGYVMTSRTGKRESLHVLRDFNPNVLQTPFSDALQSALDKVEDRSI